MATSALPATGFEIGRRCAVASAYTLSAKLNVARSPSPRPISDRLLSALPRCAGREVRTDRGKTKAIQVAAPGRKNADQFVHLVKGATAPLDVVYGAGHARACCAPQRGPAR